MSIQLSRRDMRQNAYVERSRTARGFARMLMPAVVIVLGTAVWQDPDLGPVLEQGLAEVRPAAARLFADTPLENLLSPVLAGDLASLTPPQDQLASAEVDVAK